MTTFTTWGQLLDAISTGYTLFYQAPMDYRPQQISAVVRKDGKLRVNAVYSNVVFTADRGHLERFRKA